MATLDEAKESLRRTQTFETSKLPRREELGAKFAFDDAVSPANRLVNLFRKLPIEALDEFPENQLEIIKTNSDQVYNLFEQILKFNETEPDATSRKAQIVSNIEGQYGSVFTKLFPLISFSVARTVDFNRLEEQGRAAVQSIEDKTQKLLTELSETSSKAEETLKEVQAAAAEQGVSQQAIYFKAEADREIIESNTWRNWTYVWAASLGGYGVISFFFHKWEWLSPKTTGESILFVTSKIIIFAVVAYLLVLSARNFLSHKHNSVINRHRQNALQTFQALVAAGSTGATQDIILNHAAACIFTPQETGYVRAGQSANAPTASVTDLVYKTALRGDSGSG